LLVCLISADGAFRLRGGGSGQIGWLAGGGPLQLWVFSEPSVRGPAGWADPR